MKRRGNAAWYIFRRWVVPRRGFLILLPMFFAAQAAGAQDMYIYPAKKQSQAQQDKDRYECHTWAVKQTGFDPSRPPPATAPVSAAPQGTHYQPSQPHVVKGAARGAALGAVGGAITGSAGKGAAAGAAMGGLAGGFRRRDERMQQSNQHQAQQQAAVQSAQAAQHNQRVAYNRAMAACLEGRGYTVK